MDIEKYEELREKELKLRLAELKSKNITLKSAKELKINRQYISKLVKKGVFDNCFEEKIKQVSLS